MTSIQFSILFISALLSTTFVHIWLAWRQINHIQAHRNEVPSYFNRQITLPEHQKAADYTREKTQLTVLISPLNALLLLILTIGGAIQWISDMWQKVFTNSLTQGMAVILTVLLLSSLLEMPFSFYRTFVIEARYGFNKMTLATYITDIVKGLTLGAILGLPLLFGMLWLMEFMGANWWLYAWGAWVTFNLLILFIYPSFIAPQFNKFKRLTDMALTQRIDALLQKCGFTAQGLFVMDGSKRTSHGNAYFTGFGTTKRIVFFDTLLERLTPPEIEAVLAHELGHFKCHHVLKRIAITFLFSLCLLLLIARLMQENWFHAGLGIITPSTALTLLLCFMVLPVFSFLLHPLMSYYSRKHEFEADAYAAQQTDASTLGNALVKMYQDNAATLTPDPLYSMFYDSHPPALVRIAQLNKLKGGTHE
ncbi:MAG: M48 family metallopeptidase [Candidatus Nitrotoga sp.]|nr:M48 family metallopeptidase [Candidatus Nitrotoga sp.]MBP0117292.1 M48 family metallopeptidase [Candidatus Nitrotoga sp.]MBP0123020.1 M48 family metallopeptidase [Candidatus Nitrotoga sp.]MBP0125583.1 M48 family metallopeptidase [Candidatus Nitrotoga sp.]